MTEIKRGYFLPYLDFTAIPFSIPDFTPQSGENYRYKYRWADFVINPKAIFPVIVLPIVAVMLALKVVSK